MTYQEKVYSMLRQTDTLLDQEKLKVESYDPADKSNYLYRVSTNPLIAVHIEGYPALSGPSGTHVLGRLLFLKDFKAIVLTDFRHWPDIWRGRFSAEVPNYDPQFLMKLITTNLPKK